VTPSHVPPFLDPTTPGGLGANRPKADIGDHFSVLSAPSTVNGDCNVHDGGNSIASDPTFRIEDGPFPSPSPAPIQAAVGSLEESQERSLVTFAEGSGGNETNSDPNNPKMSSNHNLKHPSIDSSLGHMPAHPSTLLPASILERADDRSEASDPEKFTNSLIGTDKEGETYLEDEEDDLAGTYGYQFISYQFYQFISLSVY